jgi:tetratricopeptide (TPR) repeat protein
MKLLVFAGFILMMFLSACTVPQYVMVPVDYTPKLYFSPDSTSILLINQFDIKKAKINNKRRLDAIKAGAFASIKYAGMQLKQLPRVKVINIADSVDLKVNSDSINPLALKYHANYVLALENYDANISLGDVQSSTVSYNSSAMVAYKLYESNGIYFKKLAGAVTEPQSETPNMGLLGNLIIHPTVGGNQGSVIAATEHATRIALQDYLPYTISHNRPLYNDPWLQPAIKEIRAGNYEKADSLLQPFLKQPNLQIVSKAAYTLAVVYEYEGDIDSAIGVAQLSMDKYRNNYAEAILNELKEE